MASEELPFAVEAPFQSSLSTTSRLQSTVSSMLSRITQPTSQPVPENQPMDFTYVPEWDDNDDDKDIIIPAEETVATDSLALLLSGALGGTLDPLERAHQQASRAIEHKREGNLQLALNCHTAAAKDFYQAAKAAQDATLHRSLQLLSQSQAKYALALKRSLKLRPQNMVQQQERIRATVRGALSSREVDDASVILESTPPPAPSEPLKEDNLVVSSPQDDRTRVVNPVDEMMELERELRAMDANLNMYQSIASIDSRQPYRMKQDGSFMMVNDNASLASSVMWGFGSSAPSARAVNKPNRVQTKAKTASVLPSMASPPRTTAMDASWWGTPGAASQVLSSSVISMSTNASTAADDASPKQILRLMDSIKALGDENSALLRQVQRNEGAKREARAAREQMRRFQEDYKERFASLQSALQKFRQGNESNPVISSNYIQTAATQEQLHRQEQLIRKLTRDLQKEKEENRRKDSALRKYETFYREVKARSAQKAAQRQRDAAQARR